MNRKLVLKAVKHNWGLTRPGQWRSITWKLYDDRTCVVEAEFVPRWDKDDDFTKAQSFLDLMKKREIHSRRVKMPSKQFERLCSELKKEPWRDPDLLCDACDGEAWKIEQYSPDGSIIRSSGEMGYIYGNLVLESIGSLLPFDMEFGASAFIRVIKRDGYSEQPECEKMTDNSLLFFSGNLHDENDDRTLVPSMWENSFSIS